MHRNRDSARSMSILARAVLVILLAFAAFDDSGTAVAQDASPAPEDTDSRPPRAYFHLFTDGVLDEISFEQLSAADQEGIMLMAERTDYGADVHGAWSAVAHQAVSDAAAQRAAYAAGINGLDEAGVQ
jgi:hypothetical protein